MRPWRPLRASVALLLALLAAACGEPDRVPLPDDVPAAPPTVATPPPTPDPAAPPAPAPPAAAPDPARELIGLWESTHVAIGSIGSAYEFREGGVVVAATLVMADGGRWRWMDGRLEVTGGRDENGRPIPSATHEVVLGQDSMVLKANGEERKYVRVRAGPPEEHVVVGTWSWEHGTGRTAYSHYAADGRVVVRIPMVARRGTFEVEGSKVTTSVTLPSGAEKSAVWTLSEDRLSRTDEKGKTSTYRKSELGGWYPVEPPATDGR